MVWLLWNRFGGRLNFAEKIIATNFRMLLTWYETGYRIDKTPIQIKFDPSQLKSYFSFADFE
jgi:hypothetical protein